MKTKDLEAFRDVPFLVWVKDEEWRYLWGNHAICDLAGEDVVGKKDSELVWKVNAKHSSRTTRTYWRAASLTTSTNWSSIPSTARRL